MAEPVALSRETPAVLPRQRILLLTDWIVRDGDWSFLRELTALGHECETLGVEITRSYGSRLTKVLVLWSGYVRLGWKAYRKANGFDVVIAYQGVAGLFYSLFSQVFGRRQAVLVLMAFFFKKRRNKFYHTLRYWFTRLALRHVDRVCCYASREAEHYNQLFRCQPGRFDFVPYGVNRARIEDMSRSAPAVPERLASGPFVFSAGSSNRDYATLFAAVRDMPVRVVVFAKRYNVAGLAIPDNVELRFDVYGDEYYNHLRSASLVVIPLDDPELSSGQMVLLEAMAFGKAVVATDVWGVQDYVEPGHTAVLVPPHDADRLRLVIDELVADPARIAAIGQRAHASVFQRFTVAQMADGVVQVLASLDPTSRLASHRDICKSELTARAYQDSM